MVNIISFKNNPFVPPPFEPFFSIKKMRNLGDHIIKHIFSLGYQPSFETFKKSYTLKYLQLSHKDLLNQIKDINKKLEDLESKTKKAIAKIQSHSGNINDFQALENELEKLESSKNELINKQIRVASYNNSFPITLNNIIEAISLLFGNLITLGLFSFIIDTAIENRINLIKENHKYVEKEFKNIKSEKINEIQSLIKTSLNFITNQKVLDSIKSKTPDLVKTHAELVQIKKERDILSREKRDLETSLGSVTAEKLTLEQSKVVHLQNIDASLKRIEEMKAEIKKLKSQGKGGVSSELDLDSLAKKLKSTAAKYTPTIEDGIVPGAMDGEDNFPADKHDFIKAYNLRYADKKTAAEIIKQGFEFAFNQLMKKDENSKYQLNASEDIFLTDGIKSIYRYIILDLIEGGRVHVETEGCTEFELKINNYVSMLPSNVKKFLDIEGKPGNYELIEVIRCEQRDDFTPSISKLNDVGVDPIGAKWILTKLTEVEKKHVYTLALEDAIKDDHPDFIEMSKFIRDASNPRVKLVRTAVDLIKKMGDAIEIKFGQNILTECWGKCLDFDNYIEPFAKKTRSVSSQPSPAKKVENWVLDPKLLGGDRSPFYSLMDHSKNYHQAICNAIEKGNCLQNPMKENRVFSNLPMDFVTKNFNVTHQMIGSRSGVGGVRCLYSNLLATFIRDPKQLTEANVYTLKKAMGDYLDKLQEAKTEWARKKHNAKEPLSQELQKLKELSDLAISFEEDIKLYYNNCSWHDYIRWLKEYRVNMTRDRAPYLKFIDPEKLSPLEIKLAAYTLGVRIGLLGIGEEYLECKADQFGRIIPNDSFIYGPNTKELLLMGKSNNTYYAIQPKLKSKSVLMKADVALTTNILDFHENYWRQVKVLEERVR